MTDNADDQHTPTEPGTRPRRLRFFLMYVLPPLIALTIVLVPTLSSAAVLPRIRVSPGFALTDQQGQLVTNESLRGEIVVFSLVSTDCNDTCAAMLAAIKDVRERAVADEDADPPLHVVTIVVDAVGDPSTLRDFAEQYEIEGDDWTLLSGSEANVRSVVNSGFEVYLGEFGGDTVEVGLGLFLTDHAGFLRAEYRTGKPNPDVIADDIGRIRTEANAGALGGMLYNAAHSLSLSCGG